MLAIAAVLGHRAYAPLLLVPLAVIDWRHAYFARRATFRRLDRAWLLYFANAFLFCFFTLVSAAWSPLPNRADWAFRMAVCFMLAPISYHAVSYLTPVAKTRAAAGVAWASVAMLVLLLFEAATNARIRQLLPPEEDVVRDVIALGRGTLLLVLLVWPARRILAIQMKRPLVGLALIALTLIPAVKFTILTNAVMLMAGAFGILLAWIFQNRAVTLIFAAALALVWATPLAAIIMPLESLVAMGTEWELPASWIQRFYIWERAGNEVLANPLGGGVGYARYLSYAREMVPVYGVPLGTMPVHPHNLFLHVWLDLGVVGAISLSGIIVAGYAGARRAVATGGGAVICAIIASLLVTAMTEWSVWQVWRFAAVWIALIAWRLSSPSVH